ncbi:MAG: helix-turn-helix domain-containing protein [Oscillospiraceae bacterium]|nr:helix-turn-helix domain-containing protein [Oscillospiraceae bacterium]
MEVNKIFGDRLRMLRLKRRMTQKDLGEIIGLTSKSISTIENGLNSTTFENLVLLATFFNVSTDYLLGLKDEP